MLAKELVKILVCPKCKGEFGCEDTSDYLMCATCKLRFPVVNGIPILLLDEAEKIDL